MSAAINFSYVILFYSQSRLFLLAALLMSGYKYDLTSKDKRWKYQSIEYLSLFTVITVWHFCAKLNYENVNTTAWILILS